VRIAAPIAIVGGLAAAALWPEAVTVDTATVARAAMDVTIDEQGDTRVRERFVVSAPVSGRLLRVDLEPGDTVVRGRTVVARLLPAPSPLLDSRTRAEAGAAAAAAEAAVRQARAERDRATAAFDQERRSLARQEQLMSDGAISRAAIDAARAAAEQAESAVHAASAAIERAEREAAVARARLQSPVGTAQPVTVVAPVNGAVLTRRRESEAVIAAGEALLELGDPSDVEVVVELLSSDAVRVEHGNRVRIEGWGGPGPLTGRVRRVEPSGFIKVSALGVEERRVRVIIELDADIAESRLGDGYRVDARIVVWSAEVVTVPLGALFRQDRGWGAFVVDGGRARLCRIEIGQRNNEVAEVLQGLSPGARVVLHPPDTLHDGIRLVEREGGDRP